VSQKVRVLIADDHPVVRAGILGMLSGRTDFEVVGEAADGEEAVKLAEAHRPDVVLMDLRMPGTDGVAATRELGERLPGSRVLVLTTYDTDADILRGIEAGATGYLLKDSPREELFRAVRAASVGETVLSPRVADRLMQRAQRPAEELSGREIELLQELARGASNREIARSLYISEATVKTHLIHVFKKLDVEDRTAAVTAALEKGVIGLE
jgi:DNA-binding NarL/FixJ family response regulator